MTLARHTMPEGGANGCDRGHPNASHEERMHWNVEGGLFSQHAGILLSAAAAAGGD